MAETTDPAPRSRAPSRARWVTGGTAAVLIVAAAVAHLAGLPAALIVPAALAAGAAAYAGRRVLARRRWRRMMRRAAPRAARTPARRARSASPGIRRARRAAPGGTPARRRWPGRRSRTSGTPTAGGRTRTGRRTRAARRAGQPGGGPFRNGTRRVRRWTPAGLRARRRAAATRPAGRTRPRRAGPRSWPGRAARTPAHLGRRAATRWRSRRARRERVRARRARLRGVPAETLGLGIIPLIAGWRRWRKRRRAARAARNTAPKPPPPTPPKPRPAPEPAHQHRPAAPAPPVRFLPPPGRPAKEDRTMPAIIDQITEAHDGLAGWQPENMRDVEQFLARLPEVASSLAAAVSRVADHLAAETPTAASVVDVLHEAASSIFSVSDPVQTAHGVFRTEHEAELARLEEPRPGEAMWDVQANEG